MGRECRIFMGSTAALVVGIGIAFAAGILNLPGYPVTVNHGDWMQGQYSSLDVFLSNVGPGYDVGDGRYNGWCIEDNVLDDSPDGSMLPLMDTTDPASFVYPCENYDSIPWDHVNYLLNHKNGSVWEIQVAMWVLALTDFQGQYQSPATQAMVADALANGTGFVPAPGQFVAVALCSDGISSMDDWGTYQDTIIEVLVRRGFEGCTPGYWKQSHHFDSWPNPPADPYSTYFDVVFGVGPHILLKNAMRRGGGGENALLRHGSAAYLNAASSPTVNFYYTVDEVIAFVQAAYASLDFETYKDMLEGANQMGCPLN